MGCSEILFPCTQTEEYSVWIYGQTVYLQDQMTQTPSLANPPLRTIPPREPLPGPVIICQAFPKCSYILTLKLQGLIISGLGNVWICWFTTVYHGDHLSLPPKLVGLRYIFDVIWNLVLECFSYLLSSASFF